MSFAPKDGKKRIYSDLEEIYKSHRLFGLQALKELKRAERYCEFLSLVILDLGTQVLRLSDDFRVDIDHAVGELRMAFGHDAVLL